MNKSLRTFGLQKAIFKHDKITKSPIVPNSNISGQALVAVIAIMTFLSSLTLNCVDLVQRTAHNWSNQISHEATIQIHPVDTIDIEQNLRDAVQLVKTFHGVQNAIIMDQAATEKLLEPWFGTDLALDQLPLPRLIIVTLNKGENIDFHAINEAIKTKIPGGQFNDHRSWVHHFTKMAHTTVFIGFALLTLVLGSLMLTIIFATRNALAENSHIIHVLYFIGAEPHFIAKQFDRHFFKTALRGAFHGGVASLVLFHIFSFWTHHNLGTAESEQITALFGYVSITFTTYGKIFSLILVVSLLTMLTSRITILTQLKKINQSANSLF
ncbi:cell division protein FtsX [Bartonella bacilliformis]|uniref:Cell division protein FtsX n=1 Tax=Bartonella bacilliformis Ver097 TaxID=1293911 RepID=A0A072R818_BARBA|nr:cell division protein FtsX [Bartonella bacilliformis]KEG21362.1 hypothetical protein H710_00311 [Bartonella bacilliformis Ver097]